jgi:large subunit ribosomal protein L10
MEAKTIGIAIRENIIKKVQERINSSSVYFFIGFNNVKSSALSDLRNQLRVVDSYVFVAKNSLINKALEDSDLKNLKDYFQGETGIISVYNEDIVKPCKVIVDFSKENESFAIKGGIIEGRKISKEELESLAKLPAKEVLLAQAVSGLAAPITGFLTCLKQVILKFVWAAEEVKKVKEAQGNKGDEAVEEAKEEKEEDKKEDKQAANKPEKQGAEKKEPAKEEEKSSEEKPSEGKPEEKPSEGKLQEEQKDKKEDKSKESKENEEKKEK